MRLLLLAATLAALLSGCWHDSADTRDRYQAAYEDTLQADAKADSKSGTKD